MSDANHLLKDARRIVVKVGSSLVTNEGRGLDEQAIGEWCRQIAALMRSDEIGRASCRERVSSPV